jgi:hypothetical protein
MFAFHDIKNEFSGFIHSLEAQPIFFVLILFFQADNVAILILESKPLTKKNDHSFCRQKKKTRA